MIDSVVISGVITPSTPAAKIGAEVWINNTCVINCEHVDSAISFEHTLSDNDGEHELRIVMKHKTSDHTELDDAGNIIRDAMLSISDIKFDEIALGQVLLNKAVYTHDFNGSQPPVDDKFFGDLGCNGTVSLKFTTPAYLWLLENM